MESTTPGTKASVACTRAKEARNTAQEENAMERDHSFLFANTRLWGTNDTHNHDSKKEQKDGNKKQRKEDSNENPLDNQDSDENNDDKKVEVKMLHNKTALINRPLIS